MKLSPSKEDYLKAIFILSSKGKLVRNKDLANYLAVKPPSAAIAIKQLAQEGLVRHKPYGHIELTNRGLKIAREIYNRHKTLVAFLSNLLGLERKTAERDACHIEHALSTQAMDRIVRFLQFLEACPAHEPRCLAAFHYYAVAESLPDFCCLKVNGENDPERKWRCFWESGEIATRENP